MYRKQPKTIRKIGDIFWHICFWNDHLSINRVRFYRWKCDGHGSRWSMDGERRRSSTTLQWLRATPLGTACLPYALVSRHYGKLFIFGSGKCLSIDDRISAHNFAQKHFKKSQTQLHVSLFSDRPSAKKSALLPSQITIFRIINKLNLHNFRPRLDTCKFFWYSFYFVSSETESHWLTAHSVPSIRQMTHVFVYIYSLQRERTRGTVNEEEAANPSTTRCF